LRSDRSVKERRAGINRNWKGGSSRREEPKRRGDDETSLVWFVVQPSWAHVKKCVNTRKAFSAHFGLYCCQPRWNREWNGEEPESLTFWCFKVNKALATLFTISVPFSFPTSISASSCTKSPADPSATPFNTSALQGLFDIADNTRLERRLRDSQGGEGVGEEQFAVSWGEVAESEGV
jgi:hypothetical protein